jgi:hypothetical protein
MATAMNRVRTVWTGVAGAPYYTNMYFNDDNTITPAQDAVNAVGTFWSALSGNIVNTVSYTVQGDVARINVATGQLQGAWAVTPVTAAGTAAVDQLPRQVQGLVRWETGTVVSGRFLRGRTFIPGLGETLNNPGGVPTPTLVALFGTAGAALIADTGNELLVWSRAHGVANPVVSATGWSQWATLRTRRD